MTRATRLTRDEVTGAALGLLDEVGLDAVSTRRLAARLGVEQPSLYWHFRNKGELLRAMAEAAMVPHAEVPLPGPDDDRLAWFSENSRSLRRTLLLHRDGARLHAGSRPAEHDRSRIAHKLAFLVSGGLPEPVARDTPSTYSTRAPVVALRVKTVSPGVEPAKLATRSRALS